VVENFSNTQLWQTAKIYIGEKDFGELSNIQIGEEKRW